MTPSSRVVEGDDPVAEDVLGVVAGAVDDDAGQLAAQDLQLGGGAAGVGPAGGEAGHGGAVGVDELGARLAGGRGPDGVLDAHAAGDLAAGAADVDVLPVVAELVEAFDDGGLPSPGVEPVGQCGPAMLAPEIRMVGVRTGSLRRKYFH